MQIPSESCDCSKPSLITLRLKVRPEAYSWLNRAAIEVNQVWNWANAESARAATSCVIPRRWLRGYELCNLAAGGTKHFDHIGADTIQRICMEYAQKRSAVKRVELRWRKSFGSGRSLGWIPLKAASVRRHGKALRYCGKAIRVFESDKFRDLSKWGCGCFAQDAVGDWYLCLPIQRVDQSPAPALAEVGIDLGLKVTATTSQGEALAAGRYYRSLEEKLGQAQRRGHKRRAKHIHRRAARRRRDALHKFSRLIVNRYHLIGIGDVSSLKLVKTKLSKAVLDCAWGELKRQLLYKGESAGRVVRIVDERNTTRRCSSCGSLSGPKGVNQLRVREWMCHKCGRTWDRDVNAAQNILLAARRQPSEVGTRSSPPSAPPSRASRPRKARIALLGAAP